MKATAWPESLISQFPRHLLWLSSSDQPIIQWHHFTKSRLWLSHHNKSRLWDQYILPQKAKHLAESRDPDFTFRLWYYAKSSKCFSCHSHNMPSMCPSGVSGGEIMVSGRDRKE